MTNAQNYLDQNYPKEQRGEIIELDIKIKNLTGHLDLSDFSSLKVLRCYYNHLTSLDISNCKKLEEIYCAANEIKQDLAIFSHLKNLRILDLGFINSRGLTLETNHPELTLRVKVISAEEWNNQFYGSLKSLAQCQNLEWICLACQKNITGSLANLPTEKLTHFGCNFTSFAPQLEPVDYDVETWQLLNDPEKFNREKIREKISQAQQRKNELLKEKEERRVQEIYRLKSKISLLNQKISEKSSLPETKFLSPEERAQAEAIIARIRAIDNKGKKIEGKALMEVYQYDCLAIDCENKVPRPNEYCWEHYFSGQPEEEEEPIGITKEEIEKVKQLIREKWDELENLEEQAQKLATEAKEGLKKLNEKKEKGETVESAEWEELKEKLKLSRELLARVNNLEKQIGLAIYGKNKGKEKVPETETSDFSESEENEAEVIASSSREREEIIEGNEQSDAEQTSEELENRTPDLRTTVETDSESETEKSEPSEEVEDNLDEISNQEEAEQAEQETTEENPRTDETEPEQPAISEPTPQELAIAQVEKYWTDNANNQGLINGKNITDILSANWKEKIANCSNQTDLIPQISELIGKIAYQANQANTENQEEETAGNSNWKKYAKRFLIGGGTLAAAIAAVTFYGHASLFKLALAKGVATAAGTVTGAKLGWQGILLAKKSLAGINWIHRFLYGFGNMGGFFKWLGTLVAHPAFWIPALIIAAIAAFYYRDKIWQGLKKVFNFANQAKKKFTNFFKKPLARFFRKETPEEKAAREKKEELEQKEAEVAEVREQITQTAEQREQLASERDRISAEEFARKNEELETKLNELNTKLEQLEQEKEKTNEEYEAIPEEIRQASEAKEEQLLKNVETGLEISFWIGVIFIFALVWKLIKSFFGLLFGRQKKANEKELTEIKESISQLSALEKQKIEREIEREKLTTAKLNAEQERLNQEKLLEQEKKQLTKQKDQQNPPAKNKRRQKKASASLTYYHRHRKEINAKRRANYRLRKEKEKPAANR